MTFFYFKRCVCYETFLLRVFLFWKSPPEVLTADANLSVVVFCPRENTKLCCILALCVSRVGGVAVSPAAERSECPAQERRRPRTSGSAVSLLRLTIPGMCSLFLLGWPTRNLWRERNTSLPSSWTPAGSGLYNGQQVKADLLTASDRLGSCWPRSEIRRCGLYRLRQEERAADWKLDSQDLHLINNNTVFFKWALQNFWRFLAFTWCTQSPEVPANLLHNGGQVSQRRHDAMASECLSVNFCFGS